MSDAVTGRDPAIEELLDKQAIREATMRYCRGVDRCDAAMISSAYHPDAYDDHSGRIFTGETVGPGIAEWMRKDTDVCTHHMTTQNIHLDGDTAGCESYYQGIHLETRDGVQRRMFTSGRYVDKFERRNGEWKIISRVVVLDSAGYIPSGDRPVVAPPTRSSRDESDPSYTALPDPSRDS
jgi:hypothetical protein